MEPTPPATLVGISRNLFGAAVIELTPSKDHPIPYDLSDHEPKTHADAVAVAVNTADLIASLGGADLGEHSPHFSDEDLDKAKALIQGANKPKTPKHVTSSAEARAAAHLIKRFDFQAFADAQQARNFVTNKLLALADCGDPKLELKALELLGKHSDIGLFTERSEITVHHTSSKSLEDSIKERVKRLMNSNIIDVTPLDDLDEQLGVFEPEQGAEEEETPDFMSELGEDEPEEEDTLE